MNFKCPGFSSGKVECKTLPMHIHMYICARVHVNEKWRRSHRGMYVSCGAVIEYSISSTATNQLFAPQVRRQKPSPCVMAACFGRMVEYGRYSNYASHQSLCSMLSLMCKLPTHSTFTICCKGSNWAFTSYAVARVPVLKRVYAKV